MGKKKDGEHQHAQDVVQAIAPRGPRLSDTGVIRALGAAHDATRLAGLDELERWLLECHDGASDLDMKKLGKGIFYCIWHADGPVYQVGVGKTRQRPEPL